MFAGYTIAGQLGSGAMGEVYLAQHPGLPRRDALKLLARATLTHCRKSTFELRSLSCCRRCTSRCLWSAITPRRKCQLVLGGQLGLSVPAGGGDGPHRHVHPVVLQ